ncbi:MAG: methylated-DNA--protein-cysteine methyltransferase [Actinomycetota bacterium]
MEALSTTTMDTPVGMLTLVASEAGVRAVLWPDEREGRVPLAASSGGSAAADAVLDLAVQQLREYFAGERREFDVPLDPVGTEFQQRAWEVLRTIPYGQTISYGEQAARLGDRNKSRAVGAANGRNPISIIVPCHRVVGSTGKLTGFAAGLDAKEWLLHHEQGGQLRLA